MLGQDRDGGSLEREGYSVDIDEGICGVCDGQEDENCACCAREGEGSDYVFEDLVDDASQEASSHLPEDGRMSRNALMIEGSDKFELQADYEPEEVVDHFKQLVPLIVDDEGWPIEPPGLSTPLGGQQPAQSTQAQYTHTHSSAQLLSQAPSHAHAPAPVSASVLTHVAPASNLFIGSTFEIASSPNLFCESTPDNFYVPVHGSDSQAFSLTNHDFENHDSIDSMVRKHIVEQSWDGGHAGKGINVSRGHRGKG